MSMRVKRRAQLARTKPWAAIDAALLPIRRARVAMLRDPRTLAEVLRVIERMKGPQVGVIRSMLREDIRLMRQLDRMGTR